MKQKKTLADLRSDINKELVDKFDTGKYQTHSTELNLNYRNLFYRIRESVRLSSLYLPSWKNVHSFGTRLPHSSL